MTLKYLFTVSIVLCTSVITFGYVTRTQYGSVRGIKKNLSNDVAMYTYLGIPYAQPPLGNFRFQPPQPLVKWKNIKETTTEKPQCIQSRSTLVRTDKIEGSEDCLYLNIYTPKPPAVKNNITYPVMFWIHGGGYYEGDNSYELYPPDNFVKQGIVVVSVAYRLGIFGFLSTGDLISPGNNGLRDQIMALEWVNENIENFGGDKNSITIWGESAGGISVSHLLSSPKTKGLFHKAIMESGASILAVAVGIDQPLFAFTTGELLGIRTNNTSELVAKLREVDWRELQAAASRAGIMVTLEAPLTRYPYTTVIEIEHEDAVITKSPYLMLEQGETHQVPVLMGVNSNEGDGLPDDFARIVLKATGLDPSTLVPVGLNLEEPEVIEHVGSLIKTRYFKNDTTDFTEENFVHWYGDMHIIRPAIQQGQLLSKYTDVYFYLFNCIGLLGNPLRSNWNGVGHAEELNYLFQRRTQPKILPDDDKLCSDRLVKLWGNFVKYGNPTPENDPLFEEVVWPTAAPVPNMKYLHVDKNLSVRVNPDEEDFYFWLDIFDTYAIQPLTVF